MINPLLALDKNRASETRSPVVAEVFNLTNTYWFGRQQFNSTATSSAFGTMNKASIAFTNTNQPRYVQLGLKFLW